MKRRRLFAFLLALVLAVSLLPAAAFAASTDNRTVITEVTADLIDPAQLVPVVGESCERVQFAVPGDAPYDMSYGYWRRKNPGNNYWTAYTTSGATFWPGTWAYCAQARIKDEEAYNYRFPPQDEIDTLTAMISGTEWTVYNVWSSTGASYANLISPEIVISDEGLPLTFRNLASYEIGKNWVDRGIQSYNVADSAYGGTKPYTFLKVSGPSWITVSPEGRVYGEPDEPGQNPDLVIRVTDAAQATAEITIPVADTLLNPRDREVVTAVTASATGLAPAVGDTVDNPVFTAPEGVPYYIWASDGVWRRKGTDVSGATVWSGQPFRTQFAEGVYYYSCPVRVDNTVAPYTNGYNYRLPNSGETQPTVMINGVPWTIDGYSSVKDEESMAYIRSPEIYVGSVRLTHVDVNDEPTDEPFYTKAYSYFAAEVIGETDQGVTWSVSGNTSSGTTISENSPGIGQLMIAASEQGPLTVTATSVADPTKTGVFTVNITPHPAVTAVSPSWNTAMLRFTEDMTVSDAVAIARSAMRGTYDGQTQFLPGADVSVALVRSVNGNYQPLDTGANLSPNLQNDYRIRYGIHTQFPYAYDADTPPAVQFVTPTGNGDNVRPDPVQYWTHLQITSDELMYLYCILPDYITEHLFVEQDWIRYDGNLLKLTSSMTGDEATALLREAIDESYTETSQIRTLADSSYLVIKTGENAYQMVSGSDPLNPDLEYYAVFKVKPVNGNRWNLSEIGAGTWPTISVESAPNISQPIASRELLGSDDTCEAVYRVRLQVAPPAAPPRSITFNRVTYGLGFNIYWMTPQDVPQGSEPTAYRLERQADNGEWTLVDYFDYIPYDSTNGASQRTDYVDHDVIADSQYLYRVRSENALGCSAWVYDRTHAATTAAWSKPAAPKNIAAEQIGLAFRVTWDACEGAQTYTVKRGAAAEEPSVWPADTELTTVAYGLMEPVFIDDALQVGWTYTYYIIAENEGNQGDNGAATTAMTWRRNKFTVEEPPKPDAPQNITAEYSDGALHVSWDPVEGADSYSLMCVNHGDDVGSITYNGASATIAWDFVTNEQYQITVYAISNGIYSDEPGELIYIHYPIYLPPVSPVTVRQIPAAMEDIVGTGIEVTAAAVSQETLNELGILETPWYTFERSVNGGEWTTLDTIQQRVFYDNDVAVGSTYTYRVTALAAWAVSDPAESAPFTYTNTPPTPGAIATITATGGPGKITVTWAASENAATYTLARQVKGTTTWTVLSSALTGTSYEDATAEIGTEYRYRVRAYNGSLSSAAINSAYAKATAPTPGAIATITATGGPGKITVTWSESENAATYNLARQKKGTTTWTSVATGLTVLTFEDATAEIGTEYMYRVRAYNASGSGPAKDSAYAKATALTPGAIASITATGGPGKITVAWAASENAATYTLARQVKGTTTWTVVKSGLTARTYEDTTAEIGTEYRYRVRAYNGSLSSDAINSGYAAAQAVVTAPGAIASITATPTAGKVTVTWSAASGAASYRLARQKKGESTWVSLGGVLTGTSYTDTTAVAGTEYRYRVRAYNAAGSSDAKNSAYITAQ